ncbi:MAG TPA: hypothetical protein VGC56_14975 [Allosphingosinicella sp.]|jgi:hypothetical protein
MIGSPAWLLAAALAPPQQSAPSAPAAEEQTYIISTIWTRPEHCNLAVATRVALPDLLREPKKWGGKCVAVDGYWQQRALFIFPPRERYAEGDAALKGSRVGIYGTEELLSSAPRSSQRYTAVGVPGMCETIRQAAVMVFGYCHYADGPYLAIAQMRRRQRSAFHR